MVTNRVALGIAPLLGLGAILMPTVVAPPARLYESPLFPLLRTAVEGMGLGQVLLLLAAGAVLGRISRTPVWGLGFAAIIFLPLAAVLEMVADPTSHNLFPIEFIVYAFCGAIVAGGARLGRPPSSD